MGRLIFTISLFLLAFIDTSKANDSTLQLQLVKSVQGDYKSFEVDNLGNVYLITNNNQLKKLNSNFDSVATFNDTRRYGTLSFVDVSNPLKLLLFYKDFSTILVLDRFLNVINTIDLRKQGIQQISSIASSYDNKIWCYDEVENKLKKIDDNGDVIFESTDFRMLFDNPPVVQKIIDSDGKVYCYNKQMGLLVFDYYGGLRHKYSILDLDDIEIADNYLQGYKNDSLIKYNLKMLKQSSIKIKSNKYSLVKRAIQQNLFFVLYSNKFDICKMQ
jgi:hypothetical protein